MGQMGNTDLKNPKTECKGCIEAKRNVDLLFKIGIIKYTGVKCLLCDNICLKKESFLQLPTHIQDKFKKINW